MSVSMTDDELEKFKVEINLVEYVRAQGYEIDTYKSSRSSIILRKGDDKLIIGTDQDGHGIYFSVREEADNGSIIDFVQKRQGINLGQVRKELRPWIGVAPTPESFSYRPKQGRQRAPKPEPSSKDRQRVTAEYMRMWPQPLGGHPYLRNRGIESVILEDHRFKDRIKRDGKGNAVFPHYDRQGLIGYELKNKDFTGFAPGGEKRLWYSANLGRERRVMFVESAIDALSHAQLEAREGRSDAQETAYVSFGGQLSGEQFELLKSAVIKARERGSEIVIGVDNDPDGDKYAEKIWEIAPEAEAKREVPGCKDWNEEINKELINAR